MTIYWPLAIQSLVEIDSQRAKIPWPMIGRYAAKSLFCGGGESVVEDTYSSVLDQKQVIRGTDGALMWLQSYNSCLIQSNNRTRNLELFSEMCLVLGSRNGGHVRHLVHITLPRDMPPAHAKSPGSGC